MYGAHGIVRNVVSGNHSSDPRGAGVHIIEPRYLLLCGEIGQWGHGYGLWIFFVLEQGEAGGTCGLNLSPCTSKLPYVVVGQLNGGAVVAYRKLGDQFSAVLTVTLYLLGVLLVGYLLSRECCVELTYHFSVFCPNVADLLGQSQYDSNQCGIVGLE